MNSVKDIYINFVDGDISIWLAIFYIYHTFWFKLLKSVVKYKRIARRIIICLPGLFPFDCGGAVLLQN